MTTVMKGRLFEQRSLGFLQDHLSMSLRRVGGKGDGGIDLQGWWWLPAECLPDTDTHLPGRVDSSALPRKRLRIIAQCKAEEKKIGPRFIREFEGTVLRHSASLAANGHDWHSLRETRHSLVGLFLSTSSFTKASLLQAYSSPIPMALLHLPRALETTAAVRGSAQTAFPDASPFASGEDDALPSTLLFNSALGGSDGLFRGTLQPRWQISAKTGQGYPGIWSNGVPIRSWTPEYDDDHLETPGRLAMMAHAFG
ncbi:hypothetical protein BC628DRAFT_1409864 [Trametes gibbosa]|nr:hypothetical protein BC628DRAFT_1409864 [Trametes gibbosa]